MITTEILMTFLTLSLLEIVLGIDNLIFIALVADNLPAKQRNKARMLGLGLALGIRVVMLFSVSWIMSLTEPLFTAYGVELSIRDLLLIGGGLFLIGKATLEMHADINDYHEEKAIMARATFGGAVAQIVVIDLVFSFDSIITAVGLTSNLYVIFAAVIVSMIVMLAAAGHIGKFLRDYPTFKTLALAFILMIGIVLVAEGLDFHIPKAYIYSSFAFALSVEALNTLARRKRKKRK